MRNFVQSDSIFTKSKNVKWNKEKEEKGNDKNKTTRITGWLEVECVEWRSIISRDSLPQTSFNGSVNYSRN